MARRISSRLTITGKLVAQTPLHVGGYGDSPDTDLPLAQNGKGEWYVAGTSIAGVLRSWCEKNFSHAKIHNGRPLIKEVFGFQNGDEGQASFISIEDATVESADEVLTEVRDSVGIDRFYGTAAEGAKYDRAVLPRGTCLNFEMHVEIGAKRESNPKGKSEEDRRGETEQESKNRKEQTKAIIGCLLNALEDEQIRFGASKTRGLGRVRLENIVIKEQSLDSFDILKALNDCATLLTIDELNNDSVKPLANARLEIKIGWRPRLPVMVKAGYDGIGVDMLPLTSGVGKGKLALCLPGSSIKGALRSHAERIIRTLLHDCPCTKDKKFNEQIDALPLIEELFGTRGKSKAEGKSPDENRKCKSSPSSRLGLGALAVDDCYAEQPINAKQWGGVEVAGVKDDESFYGWELWKRLREVDDWRDEFASSKDEDKLPIDEYKKDSRRFRINHHVAIDRWTGGASEGALYSVLAPGEIEWEEMHLTLDFDRLRGVELPALMLLLLVLRDIAGNRLPFGFATNRGMGEIEVKQISLKGGNLKGELECLNRDGDDWLVLSEGSFAGLDKGLKSKLEEEWTQWLSSNQLP